MSNQPEHERPSGGRGHRLPSPRVASVLETDESGEGSRAGEVRANLWPDRFAPVGERDPIAEAALMRRRLGSYQRGLTNARRIRTTSNPTSAFSSRGASLFISTDTEQGADQ
ncbi:hypothetical protein [Kineosporia sp. NBRC 101731]|uniref:hypothetical protein n=1 Tax=Kineosporia sp. NBRC 101731 TaxID=3032199 RepID=UPI0024A17A7B|nr:hypothetical protein [Kineosporia sp. NBRC 101731]GLY32203.1 hypothetical protein Kisp02_55680 [Kineosporia sp. NBRC 101731]